MAEFRVRYKEKPDTAMIVRMIRTWRRGDIPEAVMSVSSGPKDYYKNMVFAIFDGDTKIDAVTMVRGSGRPFFLIRIGQTFFDMAGKEVEVQQRVVKKVSGPARKPLSNSFGILEKVNVFRSTP